MIENMAEPTFRYHPDPVATGAAVSTDAACSLCGVARGLRYAGPIHGSRPDVLCLHCIHSGDASRALSTDGWSAEFTDVAGVPDGVAVAIVDEIAHRTPGGLHCGTYLAYADCS